MALALHQSEWAGCADRRSAIAFGTARPTVVVYSRLQTVKVNHLPGSRSRLFLFSRLLRLKGTFILKHVRCITCKWTANLVVIFRMSAQRFWSKHTVTWNGKLIGLDNSDPPAVNCMGSMLSSQWKNPKYSKRYSNEFLKVNWKQIWTLATNGSLWKIREKWPWAPPEWRPVRERRSVYCDTLNVQHVCANYVTVVWFESYQINIEEMPLLHDRKCHGFDWYFAIKIYLL